MRKWTYQVQLADIDAETEEDMGWYYPNRPNEPRPEFDTATDAMEVGQARYPGCQVRAVHADT